MKNYWITWFIVFATVLIQFFLEVSVGRVLVAPAILVPLLVYLSLYNSDYWSIEGAFWSGFVLDLLLHQPVGVSSFSMLCGIAISARILAFSTGAFEMTFVIKAIIASVVADLIFIFLAARPVASGFGISTLLVLPRILVSVLLYSGLLILFGGSKRQVV